MKQFLLVTVVIFVWGCTTPEKSAAPEKSAVLDDQSAAYRCEFQQPRPLPRNNCVVQKDGQLSKGCVENLQKTGENVVKFDQQTSRCFDDIHKQGRGILQLPTTR